MPFGVAAFIGLLACALTVSIAADRVRIPAAVLLVAVGALFGSLWRLAPPFAFGPTLLFVFLPPLVFEAAWTIDLAELRRSTGAAALLALPGTVVSAFAVAGERWRRGGPVWIRHRACRGRQASWPTELTHGVVAMVGGTALGAACAVPLWLALRTTAAPEHKVTATVVLAYVAYLLAGFASVSGIFATASAAIVLRTLLRRRANVTHILAVDDFWNAAACVVTAIVFLSTGLLLNVPRALHEPLLVITVILTVTVSRAVLAPIAAREAPARTTIFLAGMRGALPLALALALALPSDLPYRAQIIDGVFARFID